MKFPFLTLICTLACTNLSAETLYATDVEKLADILRDEGYRAKVSEDSIGDPMISSSASGLNFSIFFYGCDDGKECDSIQFSAGFDMSDPLNADTMNEWNRGYRYGKAYIDEEGDPYLKLDVNMDKGGVPKDTLVDSLGIWEDLLSDFGEHIDW